MGNIRSPIFIIGSDTGVGKTVVTALLLHHLRTSGVDARALKPIATGDQSDATLLSALQADLTLAEVNRWFWSDPIAPLVAARKAGDRVNIDQVVGWIKNQQMKCEVLLVETAGGLFSPLGEGFSSFELLHAFRPHVVTVIANRVGAINQSRLVHNALSNLNLPQTVVLTGRNDSTTEVEQTNCELISEFTNQTAISIPFLGLKASEAETIRAAGAELAEQLQGIINSLKHT